MIVIDSQSRQPIYEQIVEHVESLIAAGVMSQGEQLPSVRALAVEQKEGFSHPACWII